MFRAIAADQFAPFQQFQLELPPVKDKPENMAEVHLFTGVNGTGKTRILSALSAMLGNPTHLQKRLKGSEPTTFYISSHDTNFQSKSRWGRLNTGPNGIAWQPGGGNILNWCHTVPAFAYRGYAYVTDSPVSAMGAVGQPTRDQCLLFNRPEDSSKVLLQAITNLLFEAAVDSLNASSDSGPPGRAAGLVRSLETTLLDITGRRFQFKIEKFPNITLYVMWGDTKLSFDVLPDGLRAIIGWLVHALVMMDVWLQGKGDPANTEVVFLLDEIESHLHPAWQRKILPAFKRLFPKAQIFVATHSPFVIASLSHGWIHSLKMQADCTVKIEKPQAASSGDSYISVVDDIMGLKEWFDPETESLLAQFRNERDRAYNPACTDEERGQAHQQARQLALQIGKRSMELHFMMGKELNQLDRHMATASAKP